MAVKVDDPQVAAALAKAIGHPPPFEESECHYVASLDIFGARDISALAHCPSLGGVGIYRSEIDSLAPLAEAAHLTSLMVEFSSLRDVRALRGCKSLTGLTLYCCLVEDIAPLLEIQLRRVKLRGNPLSAKSAALRPKLEKLVTHGKPKLAKLALDFPTDEELELSRALHKRGLRAVHYHDRDGESLVAFPGLAHTPDPDADVVAISADQLRAELAKGKPTFESLRARYPG